MFKVLQLDHSSFKTKARHDNKNDIDLAEITTLADNDAKNTIGS